MLAGLKTRSMVQGTRFLNGVSLALVAAGVLSWVRFIDLLRSQSGSFVQRDAFLGSIGFLFLASQLTTVGVAFYAYSLSTRGREDTGDVERTLDRIESVLGKERAVGAGPVLRLDMESLRSKYWSRLSRIHVFALAEGFGLLLLYSWLVAEFQSNTYMQEWAGKNAWVVGFLLNYYALTVLAGLLVGFILSELRTSRRRLGRNSF